MVSLADVASGFGTGFQAANKTRLENETAQRGRGIQERQVAFQEAQLESKERGLRAKNLLESTNSQFDGQVEAIASIIPNAVANPGAGQIIESQLQRLAEVGANMNKVRAAENLPPIDVTSRIEGLRAQLQTQPTAQQTAATEAAGVAAKAQALAAEAEKFGSDPASAAFFNSVAGLPPEADAAFNSSMQAVLQHAQDGTADSLEGQIAGARLLSFLNKGLPEGSPTFSFGKNGALNYVDGEGNILGTLATGPGPKTVAGDMTPQQQFRESDEANRLRGAIANVDTLLELAETEPSLFGLSGSVRATLQNAGAILGGLPGISQAIDAASSFAEKSVGPEFRAEFFDPNLPANEVIANTIAMDLARTRITRGGDPTRAVETAFRRAREDLQLTGFTSVNSVKARLGVARQLFSSELNFVKESFGLPTEGEGRPKVEVGNPELRRALDKIFNRVTK
jgi:hypothetical protein